MAAILHTENVLAKRLRQSPFPCGLDLSTLFITPGFCEDLPGLVSRCSPHRLPSPSRPVRVLYLRLHRRGDRCLIYLLITRRRPCWFLFRGGGHFSLSRGWNLIVLGVVPRRVAASAHTFSVFATCASFHKYQYYLSALKVLAGSESFF